MSRQDPDTLRDWFEHLLSMPLHLRQAELGRCADPVMRSKLEKMMASESEDLGDDFAIPGPQALAAAIGDPPMPAQMEAGQHIGPYEIVKFLGEGGSASVFLAQRDLDGVQQRVAVKLLHRGLHTDQARRLFRRERQALASLSHPNIAHLIDGGETNAAQAYLVMEYVDGLRLTDYAHAQRLSLSARLRLHVTVCHAVAAAHRALIVHRDLKPSNILVDATGRVMLLDFGLAKLLDSAADEPEPTRSGYAQLTPGYAAPEQFQGGVISTATDVYALGVVLHELLLGKRPDRPALQPSEFAAQPSQGLAAQSVIQLTSGVTRFMLRGDLDNILLKALAEEPERRYAGAAELAADLERYLGHEPVLAHPPSKWYRLRKFVQRHRGGVTVSTLLALALVGALVVSLWQAHVAREATLRADAVHKFMVELFKKTVPNVAAAARPDVPTLVFNAANDLPEQLQEQPGARVELFNTIGNVLRHMDELPRSEKLLLEAERVGQDLPPWDETRLQTQVELARTQMRQGKLDVAEGRLAQLLALPAAKLPASIPRAMLLKINMAVAAQRGDRARSVQLARQMLDLYQTDCKKQQRCTDLSHALHDYATVLTGAGHAREAIAFAQEALTRKTQEGAALGSLANSHAVLAEAWLYLGDLANAEFHARRAKDMLVSLGNSIRQPPETLHTMLAEVLLDQERSDEAQTLLSALLAVQEKRAAESVAVKTTPADSAFCDLQNTEALMARAQLLQARADIAIRYASSAIDGAARCAARYGDSVVAFAASTLARAHVLQGDFAKARDRYQTAQNKQAQVAHHSPLLLPRLQAELARLARDLSLSAQARQHATEWLRLCYEKKCARDGPVHLEMALIAAQPLADLQAQLSVVGHWPIGQRLVREYARTQP